MANNIQDLLRERDAQRLVSAREADEIMRPITAFARGHMTHTMSLLARWPDMGTEGERDEAVKIWYSQLERRIDTSLDKWFQKDRSANLRGEYVAACFREAIAALMGADASNRAPEAMLARERLTGRATEIADVLTNRVSPALRESRLADRIIIIILWGEHGAHFPDT